MQSLPGHAVAKRIVGISLIVYAVLAASAGAGVIRKRETNATSTSSVALPTATHDPDTIGNGESGTVKIESEPPSPVAVSPTKLTPHNSSESGKPRPEQHQQGQQDHTKEGFLRLQQVNRSSSVPPQHGEKEETMGSSSMKLTLLSSVRSDEQFGQEDAMKRQMRPFDLSEKNQHELQHIDGAGHSGEQAQAVSVTTDKPTSSTAAPPTPTDASTTTPEVLKGQVEAKELQESALPAGTSGTSVKRGKFINDNSTNAQQMNLPDAAEVWMLAGMKAVPKANQTATEEQLPVPVAKNVSASNEKNLLDWTQIMMHGNLEKGKETEVEMKKENETDGETKMEGAVITTSTLSSKPNEIIPNLTSTITTMTTISALPQQPASPPNSLQLNVTADSHDITVEVASTTIPATTAPTIVANHKSSGSSLSSRTTETTLVRLESVTGEPMIHAGEATTMDSPDKETIAAPAVQRASTTGEVVSSTVQAVPPNSATVVPAKSSSSATSSAEAAGSAGNERTAETISELMPSTATATATATSTSTVLPATTNEPITALPELIMHSHTNVSRSDGAAPGSATSTPSSEVEVTLNATKRRDQEREEEATTQASLTTAVAVAVGGAGAGAADGEGDADASSDYDADEEGEELVVGGAVSSTSEKNHHSENKDEESANGAHRLSSSSESSTFSSFESAHATGETIVARIANDSASEIPPRGAEEIALSTTTTNSTTPAPSTTSPIITSTVAISLAPTSTATSTEASQIDKGNSSEQFATSDTTAGDAREPTAIAAISGTDSGKNSSTASDETANVVTTTPAVPTSSSTSELLISAPVSALPPTTTIAPTTTATVPISTPISATTPKGTPTSASGSVFGEPEEATTIPLTEEATAAVPVVLPTAAGRDSANVNATSVEASLDTNAIDLAEPSRPGATVTSAITTDKPLTGVKAVREGEQEQHHHAVEEEEAEESAETEEEKTLNSLGESDGAGKDEAPSLSPTLSATTTTATTGTTAATTTTTTTTAIVQVSTSSSAPTPVQPKDEEIYTVISSTQPPPHSSPNTTTATTTAITTTTTTATVATVVTDGKTDSSMAIAGVPTTASGAAAPATVNATTTNTLMPTQMSPSDVITTVTHPDLAVADINKAGDGGGTDVNIIIAITVSVIGVIALILLVAFLYLMRKRQKQMSYGQRCRPVSLDAYSLDNVSVLGSVRRKGVQRASKRSYGNVAFDDPSLRHNVLSAIELARFVERRSSIFEEFRDVPQIIARADEVPPGCEDKNRYANVIPLPETRVILQQQNGDEKTEYINANYVRGPKDAPNYYIACQAPLEITVSDFWRMIWEQQSRVIIQATDLIENGIEKCAEYLPPSVTLDNHMSFGDFQVTLKNREVKDRYAISTLLLKHTIEDASRELTHYWYKWPETGVPNEEAPIIAMLLEARASLKSYAIEQANELKEKSSTLTLRADQLSAMSASMTEPSDQAKETSIASGDNGEINGNISRDKLKAAARNQGPLTVHCSPGTGRTGTIIACDIAIRSLETPKRNVDIPQIVYYVRRGRASAVQTKEQYEFIYKVTNMYATKITNPSSDN